MGQTPAIEAEGLVKNYGKTKALAGFDLAVPAGTVYGLLGPNGAGKTTAVRVFATLLRPDGGRAQVLGHDVASEADAVRRQIGLTGQYAALDEYLTGRANLIMVGQLSRCERERSEVEMLQSLVGLAGAQKWTIDADIEANHRLYNMTRALLSESSPFSKQSSLKQIRHAES